MDRIIWNAQKVFNLNKRTKSDILPSEIIHSVKELRIVSILNFLKSLRRTDYPYFFKMKTHEAKSWLL